MIILASELPRSPGRAHLRSQAQAKRIQKGTEFTEFSYGIGNQRIKRVDNNAIDGTRSTWTFGSVERIVQGSGNAFFRRSIGGIALAEYYPATNSSFTSFLLKDHLGSIDKVVTESGVAAMTFGAFGERRAYNWQGALSAALVSSTNIAISTRGFTGHEHADGLGVIHMNGRIYDPKLGRFLQADPFVQDPKNSQSLNRYSYVVNNPLSYTDPSGYFSLKNFWQKIRPFVAIAIVAVGSAFGPLGTFAAGALAGYISTGSITGALVGAFSAVAFSAIGSQFQGILMQAKSAAYTSVFAQTGSVFQAANASLFTGLSVGQQVAKTLAHGILGGVMSFLGGGKFGHGFAAAGFTQAFSGTIGNFSTPQGRIAAASVVGGTASALTGGKFANGAVTGAFSRAFNDESERDFMTGTSMSGRPIAVPVSSELKEEWFGLAPEDWNSTGSDNLIRLLFRGRIAGAPDIQYATEYGMLLQEFERFDFEVQWWIDENGKFSSEQTNKAVSLGTYWRSPNLTSPIRIDRTRFRTCFETVCTE